MWGKLVYIRCQIKCVFDTYVNEISMELTVRKKFGNIGKTEKEEMKWRIIYSCL